MLLLNKVDIHLDFCPFLDSTGSLGIRPTLAPG